MKLVVAVTSDVTFVQHMVRLLTVDLDCCCIRCDLCSNFGRLPHILGQCGQYQRLAETCLGSMLYQT